MNLLYWLKPGIKLKRWLALAVIGIICISYGFSFFLREIFYNTRLYILSFFLIVSGIVFIYLSITYLMDTFYKLLANSGFKISLDSERLSGLLFEKRILIKGPKIVAIGGGTGISTMLRGLKQYSSNITAVVTVADDGGGSGMLRQDLGMIPPGDIRNCILALADTEPIMEKLLQYRFQDGMLKGQNFGNLFLAAMDGISENFEEAVKKMSDVLAVTGKVLPVTLNDVRLVAQMENGKEICGESNIGQHNCKTDGKILKVKLVPEDINPLQEVIEAIQESDIIILGPGSLYTSVIPNLLVKGVADAIKYSKAVKVYVCNIMTQPGETDSYTVSHHIKAIEAHTYKGIVEYCFVNTTNIPENLKEKYSKDRSQRVEIDSKKLERMGVKIITGDFLSVKNDYIRHNTQKLSAEIINLVGEQFLAKDKKRAIDYFYIKDRLKRYSNS
jgi:uncharacterized cofD-like protein